MPTASLRLAFLAAATLLTSCRRDLVRLDDVQKMAYGVKPAVVRVNALATAQFRYTAADVLAVQSQLQQDGRDVVARNLPAGEAVVDTGAGGSGSGFIVHPDGVIVTNGHVVAPTADRTALGQELRRNGAIAALVRHFPVDDLRTLYRDEQLDGYVGMLAAAGRLTDSRVVDEVELSNGEKMPFRVVRFSPALNDGGIDLAVIRVDRRRLPSLRLGDSETVGVGESIWSVGYPAVASSSDEVIGGWLSRDSDLEATFNPGTITAIKRNVANATVFQSNVAVYRGNSGGPAVNRDGDVVGISTWGHTNADQIKFLVPANAVRPLLAAAGVPVNVRGDFNRDYDAALAAASAGDWSAANENLAAAGRLFPNSPDLMRLRRDVERSLRRRAVWQRPRFAVAAAGLLVVLAVPLVVLFTRRGRRPPPADVPAPTVIDTVIEPLGRTRDAAAILGRLTILNGASAGQKLGLGGSGIRIGREAAICEIVLENPKVSRLHAEIVSIDGKVMLIDRNSSNGTYVNDQKIDRRYLRDGDIIHFGGRNAVAAAFHV